MTGTFCSWSCVVDVEALGSSVGSLGGGSRESTVLVVVVEGEGPGPESGSLTRVDVSEVTDSVSEAVDAWAVAAAVGSGKVSSPKSSTSFNAAFR